MINNFVFRDLRSAEYCQFMVSVFDLFTKSGFVRKHFEYLLDLMGEILKAAETALAAERELREMLSDRKLSDTPLSIGAVRKQIDPVYRAIVSGINVFAKTSSKAKECKELVAEMNILIARYDTLFSSRKREKKEKQPTLCDECKQEM